MHHRLPVLLALLLAVALAVPAFAAKAPTEIAGITLGADAESLRDRLDLSRLKYKDDSLALFNKLAKELTARYGVPTPLPGAKGGKYKGLRWLFGTNKTGGTDLLLEHFEKGSGEEPVGNVIRVTDNGAIKQERACYDGMVRGAPEPQPAFPLFEIDETWLLPK
jgi:hypothetical protein